MTDRFQSSGLKSGWILFIRKQVLPTLLRNRRPSRIRPGMSMRLIFCLPWIRTCAMPVARVFGMTRGVMTGAFKQRLPVLPFNLSFTSPSFVASFYVVFHCVCQRNFTIDYSGTLNSRAHLPTNDKGSAPHGRLAESLSHHPCFSASLTCSRRSLLSLCTRHVRNASLPEFVPGRFQLRWTLCFRRGLTLLDFLALFPATGTIGLVPTTRLTCTSSFKNTKMQFGIGYGP